MERLSTANLDRRSSDSLGNQSASKVGHKVLRAASALMEGLNDILSEDAFRSHKFCEAGDPIVITRCEIAKDRKSAVVYWV